MLLLLFLLPAAFASHPTCPNGQQPKLDRSGKPLQCLPGASQRAICGTTHACFFTGMNYMCCPNNEPTAENQPTCEAPSLTVLDPHGLPLRCSPRTRQCPQARMFCSDVGSAFICCENLAISGTPSRVVGPKIPTSAELDEGPDCPAGSIGMLQPNGARMYCSAKMRCIGENVFCFGEKKGICCEKYDFAVNVLDFSTEEVKQSVDPTAQLKDVSKERKSGEQSAGSPVVDSTTLDMTSEPESSESPTTTTTQAPRRISKRPRTRRPVVALPDAPSSGAESSESTTLSTTATNEETSSLQTTTQQVAELKPKPAKMQMLARARAHAAPIVETPISVDKVETVPLVSDPEKEPQFLEPEPQFQHPARPSEILSTQCIRERKSSTRIFLADRKQDKRVLAQHYLMNQIRNGWPYDERFYRPDLDMFTPEQRREMGRIRFSNN